MLKKNILLTFFLVINFIVFSQEFHSVEYNKNNNIPDNYIYSIARYNNGDLWVGTSSGLAKYDGYSVHQFFAENNADNLFVTSQEMDKHNNLWIGLYDGTIAKLQKNTISTAVYPSENTGKICSIIQDTSSNIIWALSLYGNLIKISEKDTLTIKLDIKEPLNKMVKNKNNFYILNNEGIYKYNCLSKKSELLITDTISDFLINKNTLIFASNQGITIQSLINNYQIKLNNTDGLLSNNCNKLFIKNNKLFTLHNNKGISIIYLNNNYVKQYSFGPNTGVPKYDYRTMFVDNENIIWLGSNGNGLVKVEFSLFNLIKTNFDFPISSIYKDSLNNVWIGSNNELYKGNIDTKEFKKVNSFTSKITSVLYFNNTNIYIGTENSGLAIYNNETNSITYKNKTNGFFTDRITNIYIDNKKRIWISSLGNGVILYKNNIITEHFNTSNKLIHNYIKSSFLDSKQHLWFYTYRTSLSYYNLQNKKFTILKPKKINFGIEINGICQDKEKNIWFAINGNGLLKYNNKEFNWYGSSKEALLSNYCYSIFNDKYNRIWVSHKNGFSLLYITDSMTITFNTEDDFPVGSNSINSIIELDSVNILGISGNNLVKINTSLPDEKRSVPFVKIDRVLINGENQDLDNEIILKHGRYSIEIEYLGISLKKESPLTYKYKLEGVDNSWSELSQKRKVQYSINNYGTYTFKLIAKTGYKSESKIKTLTITISKPFYLEWWFIVISIIIILGLPILLINRRIRRIETYRQILEQRVKDRTGKLNNKTKELAKSNAKVEELLREFIDTMRHLEDVYFRTDNKFNYVQLTPSILKLLKIKSFKNIIGKSLTTFWEYSKEEEEILFKKIITEKSIKDLLFEFRTPDGKINFGKTNIRAIYKNNKLYAVEGFIKDVTSDIIQNEKIKNLNRQQKILINNIPSAIYYKDLDLKYIQVNKYFANLMKLSSDDIIGKTDREIASKEIIAEYEALDIKVISTKKPITNHVKHHVNEGSWISTAIIPILDINNNVSGIIGVVRDITTQIEHENALKESKSKIEATHKDITDNIYYAKTIQEALLPSFDIVNTILSDYFVLFKPRDLVSGDFYYINKIDKDLIFSAADCTGHGVSGAFLTILGITYLHDIVIKKEIDEPGKALNMLRYKVKETFKTFGSANKDGLDIALCGLDIETNILKYSGAYNPLWIIRDNKLIEYKATRNPIGYYINEKDFETHTIQLQKNDTIYIFSDGYADQFGGIKNKKLGSNTFKKLLLENNNKPMKEQKIILESYFNKWKGNTEQIDDVVILGIKI